MPVFAHYNLNDLGTTAHDSALGNGAQDGYYLNGAASDGERAVLDGQDDVVKILRDDVFQMDRGTLDIKFTIGHESEGTETIISRDSTGTTDGGFRMERLEDGTLRITHESGEGGDYSFETDAGFANEGDLIRVSYSWDAEKGGGIVIDNFTQETGDYGNTPAGLTMDQSSSYMNQQWIIGAGQTNSTPGAVNNLNQHFNGTVEFATFSDTVDNHEYNDDPNPQPDTAVTDEDTPVTIPVLDNDRDPNGDDLTVTGGSSNNGTVTVNDDGSITYTPNPDFNGEDTITYTVTDPNGNTGTSTVTVTVNPVNDNPTANDDAATTGLGTPVTIPVLANDTDVDGDPLTIDGTPTSPNGTVTVNPDGTITFTPDADFSGETTISYTVTDGNGGTDTGTVNVTVGDGTTPPVGDGYVDGGAGNDYIDVGYTGDPDGDRVDANDAILPGTVGNDDYIRAGAGNDTIDAGLGEDTVEAGAGNDLIYHSGGTAIYDGGDDRDTFVVGNSGFGGNDTVNGGGGGDDYDILDLTGTGPFRIVDQVPDAEGNGTDGTVQFLDADGNVTSSLTYTNIEEIVPCFTPGALIATPRGEVPVESLKAGDKVITRDNGIQTIRWVGAKKLSWQDLSLNPHLKPILIRRGSLGNGLPERDMMVSPNHRMLVSNDRTALYFDEHEVLVAAKHLVAGKGVHEVESMGTTYLHFMFDRHEVVLSNGAWTESFQPGDYTLKGMGNAQRNEIFELFPDLKTAEGRDSYSAARRTLKKFEARLLTH